MPELPEVETVKRGLAPAMVGATFQHVEQRRANLRFPFPERFIERLQGVRVETLNRRAKFLLATLSTGETLIMHLGMSGRFIVEDRDTATRPGDFHHAIDRLTQHDHVVFTLSSGFHIIYNDTRRFGFMELVANEALAQHPYFSKMGVEPLGNEFSADLIDRLFARKKTPLKSALLDQHLIAGLGNIYVCEALHRAHLAPDRLADSLSGGSPKIRAQRELLTASIRDVLNEAIEAGGSTLKDYAHTDGSLGYFQHRFRVYDRDAEACPTPRCPGIIQRVVQSGRSTFFCPKCQE